MRSALRKCESCNTYTLKDTCPSCGKASKQAAPPRYSPDDRYGEYRRKSIIEEYGENGKCDKVL
ncbi:MAG: RNA-protein complex protein Nop10 [Candidatus Methanomethylophilaceae archaeon]|jgi:H/ACA ribonucleoprotein complex subunit 3|nr:RNA-protein complex protein Nop10 [Candidatus Methanomethylophilaceae archaeon]MBO5669353.1 RNA-protein complex protein Nop10 [Candidatus Methanomethylophilaceae archaeon]